MGLDFLEVLLLVLKKALDANAFEGRKGSVVFGQGYQFLSVVSKALELSVDEVELGFNVDVNDSLERMDNGFFPAPIDVIG